MNAQRILLTASVFLLISGCPQNPPINDNSGDPARSADRVSTLGQRITTAEFNGLIAEDADLASIVEFARTQYAAGELLAAGVVGEIHGAQINWATFDSGGAEPVVVARHCENGDCVSGVIVQVNAQREIAWQTPDGPIPIRTIPEPFLKIVFSNDNDPDGSARIAAIDPLLLAAKTLEDAPPAAGAKGRNLMASDRSREFHLASEFGSYITKHGSTFSALLTDMRAADFTSVEYQDETGEAQMDALLTTLGPDDVFVYYGHGCVSESQGVAIGMEVNSAWVTWELYGVSRMQRKLEENPRGGPGMIFLAGCHSGDLVDDLDDPQRISIGFSKDHTSPNIRAAMRAFMKSYTDGATLGEALEATNRLGIMSQWDVALIANPSANMNKKFEDAIVPEEPDPEDPLPHIYHGTGFMDVTVSTNFGSRTTRSLSQSVDVTVRILGDHQATAIIKGHQALSHECPSGSDPGGDINEIAYDFTTAWSGEWKGTPDNGKVDLLFTDQGQNFKISCEFNLVTISGQGSWAGTYPATMCTSVTLTQSNDWSFLHVPRLNN